MDGEIQFSNFAGVDLGKMPSIARGRARVVVAPVVVATESSLKGFGRPLRAEQSESRSIRT